MHEKIMPKTEINSKMQKHSKKQPKRKEIKYNEPDIVFILLMLFFFGMVGLAIYGFLTS